MLDTLKKIFGAGPPPRRPPRRNPGERPARARVNGAPQRTAPPDKNVIITDIDLIKNIKTANLPDINTLLKDLRGSAPFFISKELDLYSIALSQASDHEKKWIQRILTTLRQRHPQRQPRHHQIDTLVFHSFRDLQTKRSIQSNAQESSRIIDTLLRNAIDNHATDVHIEVRNGETFLLERIYGKRHLRNHFGADQGAKINHGVWNLYVNQPFSESDAAKDGRFIFEHNNKKWLVRVSYAGSKANKTASLALRLRDMHHIPSLDQLGYDDTQLNLIRQSMRRRGMILIVGSVNSGKSTTQTAICKEKPAEIDKNFELSDQIEVELNNFVQIQLPTEGTQAIIESNIERLMRVTTRQDVNFIAINEIRDKRTAAMASSMLLQGTAAIASIHGASWSDALNRLGADTDLGISPQVLHSESFLSLIITQTLLSILCPQCALTAPTSPDIDTYFNNAFRPETRARLRFHNRAGCPACQHTGVTGLTVCAETIPVDVDNRELLKDTTAGQAMRDWMHAHGILTYHEHALNKISAGLIDPMDVEKKLGPFTRYNIFEQHKSSPRTP